jgi:DNA invertase Pin-like site-specific DNA recombinase
MTATMAKRVFGYLRCSTDEQATNGHGLDAQRAAIQSEADRRGWTVEWITDDGYSAKNLERPGIARVLEALHAPAHRRKVDGLVVARLDRLTRSLLDFAGLMERARREKWAMVALDLGVDTSTSQGELMANVLASFAQFERRLIGQRTREGLAAARAKGVRLGNPDRIKDRTPEEIRQRILKRRARGISYGDIAAELDAHGIPTPFGGVRWYASSVRAVALRAA